MTELELWREPLQKDVVSRPESEGTARSPQRIKYAFRGHVRFQCSMYRSRHLLSPVRPPALRSWELVYTTADQVFGISSSRPPSLRLGPLGQVTVQVCSSTSPKTCCSTNMPTTRALRWNHLDGKTSSDITWLALACIGIKIVSLSLPLRRLVYR